MTGLDSLTTIVENLAVVIAKQERPTGAGEITAWGTSQIILIAVLVAMVYLNIRSQNLLFKAVAPIQEVSANQKIHENSLKNISDDFKEHKEDDKVFQKEIIERTGEIDKKLFTIQNQK